MEKRTKEIERKFLIENDSWRESAGTGALCRQGYIFSDSDKSVRLRVMGDTGYLTVKAKADGIARFEYEYRIPVEDADAMIGKFCKGAIVEKVRYELDFAGMAWVVDEFKGDNDGLVMAEVELADENQYFKKPAWAGQEVTEDKKYLNVSLAQRPFNSW